MSTETNRLVRIELIAAVLGIAGAFMMALMADPALAFAAFLVSNVGWMVYSAGRDLWPLFAQQAIFLLSSLLGLWNWWLGPLVLG